MPVASACRGLHACGAGCGAALAVSLLCARSGAAVAPLVESAGQPAARAVVDDVEVLILLSGARHMRSQWPQQREFVQEAAASLQAAMDDVIERCFSDTYDHAPAGDAVECVGGDVRVATALYNTEGVHQLHPLIDASMVDDAGLSAAFEKAGGEGLYASFGAWHPALRACGETLRATELGGPPRRRFCLFVADPQADACEDRVDNDADDPCKEFPDLCPDESDTGGEVLEMTSDLAACSKYVSNGQLVDIREGDAGALTGIHLLLALTAEQVQLNSNPHLREFITRATSCSFHENVHEVDVPAGERIVTDWVLDSSCNSFSMRRDLARLSGAAPPTFAAALRGAVAWTLPPAPDAVPTPAPTPAAPPTAAPAPAAPAPAAAAPAPATPSPAVPAASGAREPRPAQDTAAERSEPASDPRPSFGWLPEGCRCNICFKNVVDKGGVLCGRQRRSGDTVGCAAGVCWKCMNKASKDKLGAVRTTKAEFASLGEEAWWMHEACMDEVDRRDYDGDKEDYDDGGRTGKEEERFAWE